MDLRIGFELRTWFLGAVATAGLLAPGICRADVVQAGGPSPEEPVMQTGGISYVTSPFKPAKPAPARLSPVAASPVPLEPVPIQTVQYAPPNQNGAAASPNPEVQKQLEELYRKSGREMPDFNLNHLPKTAPGMTAPPANAAPAAQSRPVQANPAAAPVQGPQQPYPQQYGRPAGTYQANPYQPGNPQQRGYQPAANPPAAVRSAQAYAPVSTEAPKELKEKDNKGVTGLFKKLLPGANKATPTQPTPMNAAPGPFSAPPPGTNAAPQFVGTPTATPTGTPASTINATAVPLQATATQLPAASGQIALPSPANPFELPPPVPGVDAGEPGQVRVTTAPGVASGANSGGPTLESTPTPLPGVNSPAATAVTVSGSAPNPTTTAPQPTLSAVPAAIPSLSSQAMPLPGTTEAAPRPSTVAVPLPSPFGAEPTTVTKTPQSPFETPTNVGNSKPTVAPAGVKNPFGDLDDPFTEISEADADANRKRGIAPATQPVAIPTPAPALTVRPAALPTARTTPHVEIDPLDEDLPPTTPAKGPTLPLVTVPAVPTVPGIQPLKSDPKTDVKPIPQELALPALSPVAPPLPPIAPSNPAVVPAPVKMVEAPQVLPATPPAALTPAPQEVDPRMERILSRNGVKGLKGFCPVALREERALVDVNPQFNATHRGQRFQFSSPEAKLKFETDPARYAPAAYGADVVVLIRDKDVVEGVLDHAAWFKGRLYLFSTQANHDEFLADPAKFTAANKLED